MMKYEPAYPSAPVTNTLSFFINQNYIHSDLEFVFFFNTFSIHKLPSRTAIVLIRFCSRESLFHTHSGYLP